MVSLKREKNGDMWELQPQKGKGVNDRSGNISNQERNLCEPGRFSSFRYRTTTGLNSEE